MTASAAVSLAERGAGALVGAALGDALGAPLEGGPLERAVWALVCLPRGRVLRWTDDTQMSLASAESLLARGGVDCDDLARRWAAEASFWRGYGPATLRLLARVRSGADWRSARTETHPEGSFGNGAAMRAGPFALYYRDDPQALRRAAAESAAVTHAHPLGVEGSVLMASALAAALDPELAPREWLERLLPVCASEEFRGRLEWALGALGSGAPPREVRRRLGAGVAAHESVVTALYAFAAHAGDFRALMDFAAALGGDVDTIGGMAGGLFGARHGIGALPAGLLERLEERTRIERLGRALVAARPSAPGRT